MGHDEELSAEQININISPFRGALKRTWHDFCATSSIHGLKYTRDEDTNRIVRFVWILISLVMFICAIVMVQSFYEDYRSNPTRVNVENDHTPVTNIYFPTVTICPEVLFNMQKSKSFIETLHLPPNANVSEILSLLTIFYGFMVDDNQYPKQDIDLMQSMLQLNNLTLDQFLSQVRWDCRDLLYRCRYHNQIMDCDKLFQLSKTFNGHCCSFNIFQPGLNFTAQYAAGGLPYGLSMILRYNDKSYDLLQSYSHGFKLFINEPEAHPSAHAVAKFISLNTETFVTMRPEQTFSSNAVKALPIEERSCIFRHEFHLRYFAVYIYSNCELNCRVTNMVRFCGCLTYFFDLNRTQDRICTFSDIPCLVDRFSDIMTRKRKDQCYCPLSCERFEYDAAVSSMPLHLDVPTVDPFYKGIAKDYAVAHIYMSSLVYRRVRLDLLSNMVTLVSNLGSAFSLFVGMSMLSVVEIIYYFTIILHKNYKMEVRARDKHNLQLFTKKSENSEQQKNDSTNNKKSPFIIYKA